MSTVLIDCDILLYKHAFANFQRTVWDEDTITEEADLDQAIKDINAFTKQVTRTCGCDKHIMCLTGDRNFRYKVLPTYKHNRADLPDKPQIWYDLRKHITDNHPVWLIEGLEADDVMGIYGSIDPAVYTVASADKDLRTIPCWLYNWMKDKAPRLIEKREADMWFYTQCLTGDSTDGYKGCPGIGPKRAAKLLDEIQTDDDDQFEALAWEAIVAAYEAKGLTEEDAIQQARVARILRNTEWDDTKHTYKLWTPPAKDNHEQKTEEG
jgi:DNA polymerase-1